MIIIEVSVVEHKRITEERKEKRIKDNTVSASSFSVGKRK